MLLAVDIGNSSISLGLFPHTEPPAPASDRPSPEFTAKLSANPGRTADEYAVIMRSLMGDYAVRAAVIGSVVPQLTHTLEVAIRRLYGGDSLPVLHIGGGVRTGISLRVDDPTELGADIVTNAAAAVRLYGAPVVFIDLGTATVCGAVNAARELVGVAIAPGVSTSLAGLHAAAARIPYLELKAPEATLGRNTPDAIRSGLIGGTACMLDGWIERIRADWQLPSTADLPIVATGGLASLVLPECRRIIAHEPDLTLLGLYFIYTATAEREARHKR